MRTVALLIALVAAHGANAQQAPDSVKKVRLEVRFSRPLAVLEFLQALSAKAPPSPSKTLFAASEFNTARYTDLITAFDSIPLDYTYEFHEYPYGQKIGGSIESMLKRTLVISNSVAEFRTRSIGLIPMCDLNQLTSLIDEFTPVYDKVIYEPARPAFEKQLRDIEGLVASKDLGVYFEQVREFYRASWDDTIPFIFTFYPLLDARGFTATAFGNIAVSAIPTTYTDYAGLLSVILHEATHILFDEQSLAFKKQIDGWFTSNPSKCSHYAYGLLNESWATAIGNGYFLEKMTGRLNPGRWYAWKYNDQMAKQVFPLIKEYLDSRKAMDKPLVDAYVAIYESKFPAWITEWDNLLTGRFVMSENPEDFDVLERKFPYSHLDQHFHDFSEASFQKLREAPVTKLVVVSKDNRRKLDLVRSHFSELADWRPNPERDFTFSRLIGDKTQLIVINLVESTLEKQLETRLELH